MTGHEHRLRLGVRAALCLLALAAPAIAEQVSGGFEHSERGRIDPKFAAAWPTRASWDLNQEGIEILLTAAPIDAEAAVASLQPGTHAINQEVLHGTDRITVAIWNDGRIAINAAYDRGNAQFVDNTGIRLKAELTTNTEDRVAGRLWTDGSVELQSGDSYAVDLAFDVPITRPPKSKALGGGGGEPGAAFRAAMEASLAGKWKELAPLLAAEERERIENGWAESDEERAADLRERFCQTPEPCGVEVLGGDQRVDGVADLDVAIALEGYRTIHRVRMVREQERWVFDTAVAIGFE